MEAVEPAAAGERALLFASLERARETMLAKLVGVPVALLGEPIISSEANSLLAVVRHLTMLERWSFAYTFAGLDLTIDRDRPSPASSADRVLWQYRVECARSRRIAAGAELDDLAARPGPNGQPVVLRWVALHMIADTNRYVGHADVIRHLIDGAPVA